VVYDWRKKRLKSTKLADSFRAGGSRKCGESTAAERLGDPL